MKGLKDLDLSPVAGGTRVRLRVKAGSRENAILGGHDGALKLSVAAAPDKGRANKAATTLLAKHLGLAPSALIMLGGRTTPEKTFLVPLPPNVVRKRLAAGES